MTRNAVTEYLASDEDDSAFEGRMKNVLEGGALGAIGGVLIKSAKALKNGKKLDGTPESRAAHEESVKELEQTMIDADLVTQDGLEATKGMKKLLPEASLRVQAQLSNTRIDYGGSPNTTANPTSPIPNYPKC